MTHPDDLAADVANFDRVIAGEIAGYTMDKRWIRKDGQVIHSIMSAKCVRRSDGSVDYFVGLVQDISARKHAEEELRRNEAYLAQAQALSHTGSWALNVKTGELFWSKEHFRIVGLDPETTRPTYPTALQVVHPEDRLEVQQKLEKAIAERVSFEIDSRIVQPDGTIKYIHSVAHPLINDSGNLIEYVGTIIDTTERREAEFLLRAANEKVKTILDSITDQFFALDKEWRFAYFNKQGAEQLKTLGKDPGRLIGKVAWEEFPGNTTLGACAQAVDEGVVITEEHYSEPLREWVENRIFPNRDGGVTIFQRYVTDRKQAEAKLRRSEANLAEGQRLSHTGSWAWNATSGEIFCSRELLRIFGLEDATAAQTHETFLQLIHPEDRERIRQAFDEAMQGGTDYEAEYRVVRADGSLRHVHNVAHPAFNKAGELIEYVGTAMDITERKRTEEKLSESERRFRLLIESIPHHVWSFRPDGSVGYWNQRLIDYTGVTPEQLRQGTWEPLHPDDKERVKAAWQEAWADGAQYEMEQRIRGRDGRYRRFACRGVAVKDEQGRAVEWFGTNTDIEDRKQAEEALNRAQTELERVSRKTTMGELAASIAHEINQPLGAIVNNGNVCLQLVGTPGAEEKKRAALADIVSDANRASAIIARIRALTRRSTAETKSLNLKDIIFDVLLLAERQLVKHQVTVKTRLTRDLAPVLADRVQLQQVLLNLVINGIEAMSAAKRETRVLEINAKRHQLQGASAILVTVRDSGIGLKTEEMDRLFEAFYTTKPEGMGMGLRISRSIVEAHGGRLWAKQNAGPGATFYCSLPIATEGRG
jgi:PAS domain S-box-containing protein